MAGRKQFDVDIALDAAVLTFWCRGYADTSVSDLEAATGLGRGSLYAAFGSKDVLFHRVLARYAGTWGPRFDAALSRHPGDARAAVAALFTVLLERLCDPALPDGCLIALTATQAATVPPSARSTVAEILAGRRARLRSMLARCGADDGTADELALFVTAQIQALAVLSRAGHSRADLERLAAVVVRALTLALSTPAPGSGEERPSSPARI